MTNEDLLGLADALDACAEDAKRPEPFPGYPGTVKGQPASVVSLANAISHIANALRSHAMQSEDPGIPVHPNNLVEKGIEELATKVDGLKDGGDT